MERNMEPVFTEDSLLFMKKLWDGEDFECK